MLCMCRVFIFVLKVLISLFNKLIIIKIIFNNFLVIYGIIFSVLDFKKVLDYRNINYLIIIVFVGIVFNKMCLKCIICRR